MEKLDILIVREDTTGTHPLRHQLERLGHTVIDETQDARDASRLIGQAEPDVVLLQHGGTESVPEPGNHPQRPSQEQRHSHSANEPDACALARTLSEEHPVPMILASTRDDPALAEWAHAANVDAYLVLPVGDGELSWALTTAVTRFRDRQALHHQRAQTTEQNHPQSQSSNTTDDLGKAPVPATGIDVGNRRQTGELLQALNAAALAVQQTRTPQEIFGITARELGNLGFDCAVLLSDDNQEHLKIVFTSFSPQAIAKLEKSIDLKRIDVGIPIDRVDIFKGVCRDRQAILITDPEEATRQFLPQGIGHLAPQMMRLLDAGSFIAAPIVAGDALLGLLSVHSPTLTELHVPAVTAFANQLAIALENAHLFQAQTQRRQEAETLRQITAALTSTLDLNQVLDLILEQLAQVVAFDSAAVFLAQGPDLAVVAGRGFPDMARVMNLVFSIEDNALFRQIQIARAPLVLADAQADDRFLGKGGTDYVRAWMGIPLLVKDQVIGCLTVDSRQPNVFDLQDAELVQAYANQAAVAIENAHLFEAEARRRREAETLRAATQALSETLDLQRVFELILSELQKVVPYDSASVQQLIGDRLEIIGGHGFPNLEELVGVGFDLVSGDNPNRKVVRTRAPFILNDAPTVHGDFHREPHAQAGIRSWLGVPLLLRDRLIGMIALDKKEPGFYTQEHARLALAFAAQAAIAIENAQMFANERAQTRRQTTLFRLSAELAATLDEAEVCQRVVNGLRDTLGHDHVALFLADETTSERVLAARIGWDDIPADWRVPPGQGLSERPLLDGQLHYTPDVTRDPRYIAGLDGSEVDVPLRLGDKALGVLVVESAQTHAFGPDDFEVLTAAANQTAVAIQNARLFKAQARRRQEAETLRQVSHDLIALRDLDTLLHQIIERAMQLLDGGGGGLYLHRPELEVLEWAVAIGDDLAPIGTTLRRGEGLSGKVWETGEPLIIEDYDQWPNRSPKWEHSDATVLGVPIQWGSDLLGVLNIRAKSDRAPFTSEDAALLSQFAAQAAIAIENARLHEAQRQQADELARIHRASATLFFSATSDLTTLAQNIVEAILREFGQANCSLLLLDPVTGELERIGAAGAYVSQVTRGHLRLDGPGLVPRAMRTGQVVNVPDVTADPDYVANWDQAQSEMAVPLQVGERVIGALDVQSSRPAAFGPVDERLLTTFAERAALALENAQLYQETLRRANEMTSLYEIGLATVSTLSLDDVLMAIYDQCQAVLPCDNFYIALHRPGERYITFPLFMDGDEPIDVAPVDFESGEGFTAYIIREQRPLVLDAKIARKDHVPVQPLAATDAPPDTYLGVPLVSRDEVIGVLSIQSSDPEAYSDEHVRLLTTIANQAAIAIENARLYQETARRADEMASLYEIGLATSHLDIDAVLVTIYEQCCQVMNADVFYIALYEPQDNEIVFPFFFDQGERLEPLRVPADIGFAGWIIKNQQPFCCQDTVAEAEELPIKMKRTGGQPARSYLGVPLLQRERVIGVLSVQSYAAGVYGETEIQLLTTIANQAAIAIENARLYQESQQREAAAITLYEATRPVPSLDLPNVLETLAERALALTDLSSCIISLLEPTGTAARTVSVEGLSQERAQPLLDRVFGPSDYPNWWQTIFVEHRPLAIPNTHSLSKTTAAASTAPTWDETDPPKATLTVPLMASDRLIGSLQLVGAARPLPDELVRRVETFAAQAAITIENARLYKAVQEYARSLQIATWEKEQLLEQLQQYAETLEQQVAQRTAQIFAEKEKVEAILKSAGDAIIITDLKGRISFVNDAFTTLTGYRGPEVIGLTTGKVLFVEQIPPTTMADLRKATAEGRPWRGDICVAHKDGHAIECDLTLAPIRDESGQATSLVGGLRDVSQAKALERAKSQFLTNVSHQLRTPVTNLKTYTFLLSKGAQEKEAQYMQIMGSEVDRLLHLVQDLLEIAELDAGPIVTSWEPIVIADIIDFTMTRFQTQAAAAGLALKAEVTSDLPPVLGSQYQLAKALNQIVENALSFTVAGEIIISARLAPLPTQSGIPEIVISISDTGPGIPVQEQDQIFERFFRGKAAQPGHIVGTGLGLAMAQMIVKAHNGRIEVQSTVGRGSTFELRLPVWD